MTRSRSAAARRRSISDDRQRMAPAARSSNAMMACANQVEDLMGVSWECLESRNGESQQQRRAPQRRRGQREHRVARALGAVLLHLDGAGGAPIDRLDGAHDRLFIAAREKLSAGSPHGANP